MHPGPNANLSKTAPGAPRFFVAAFLVSVLISCHAAPSVNRSGLPGDMEELSLSIQDMKRTARIYVPAGYNKQKLPVIVLLHGSGSDGYSVARQSGMSLAAQQRGFIVVYPDALPLDPQKPASAQNPRVWADGTGRGFAGENPENDVIFIRGLLNRIFEDLPADPDQVHIAGFSNGGSMTFRLARELPELFRRIAVVAGVSWLEHMEGDKQDLLYITARQDSVIPPNKEISKLPHSTVDRSTSVSRTLMQWMDQCRSSRDASVLYLPRELQKRTQHFDCNDRVVQYLELPRTAHVWPGGQDDPVGELNATTYIVRFLLDGKRQSHALGL